MKINKTMSDSIKSLAQYHSIGSEAIQEAFIVAKDILRKDATFGEFYEKINIREINNINFLYSTDKEEWASDEIMIEYFTRTFAGILIQQPQ